MHRTRYTSHGVGEGRECLRPVFFASALPAGVPACVNATRIRQQYRRFAFSNSETRGEALLASNHVTEVTGHGVTSTHNRGRTANLL